jgi:hypothetical protein
MPGAQGATSAAQSNRNESLAKVILTYLVGFFLFLLLLEGAVRMRQLVRYGSARKALYETIVDPASGLIIPTPGQVTLHIRIDSRGLRNPELVVPKPEGTLRLAFLGESNTFGQEASSNEATWPYLATKYIGAKFPNTRFDFINAAVPNYTVSESSRVLTNRIKPLDPDVIIINHAALDLYADTHKLATEEGLLYRGWTSRLAFLDAYSVGWGILRQRLETDVRLFRAQREIGTLRHFDPQTLSIGFHQKLAALVEAAQQQSRMVVLVTYPYKARRNQSPQEQLENCSTTILYAPWMSVNDILNGFDEYNRVVEEVGREQGVLVVDARDVIPGDDLHFFDSVHYKDAGSALLAKKVTDELAGAIGGLVQTRNNVVSMKRQ